jgi:E3 ubiquitin-protein ligase RGLG
MNVLKKCSPFLLAASTHDQEVFSFYPENQPCNGFQEALERYREIVPTLRLAGLFK